MVGFKTNKVLDQYPEIGSTIRLSEKRLTTGVHRLYEAHEKWHAHNACINVTRFVDEILKFDNKYGCKNHW